MHVSVRWVCAGTSDKIVCCNCNNALVQKQHLFPRDPLFLHATSLVNKEVKFLNRPVDGDYQSSEIQKGERGEVRDVIWLGNEMSLSCSVLVSVCLRVSVG